MNWREMTPTAIEAHNAKAARDAQAARERAVFLGDEPAHARSNPRLVLKLNAERPKSPSICAQEPAVAAWGPKSTHDSGVWRFCVPGQPMGAPRMTQSDKWRKRPCVLRYREWCDRARSAAPADMTKEPARISMQAFLEMPESWSKKKRSEMRGQLHRQKPDIDNLGKSCADSLFLSDCMIAMMTLLKRWDDGKGPRVEIEVQA